MTFPDRSKQINWILGLLVLIGELIVIQSCTQKRNPQITEIKIEKSQTQQYKLGQIGNHIDYIKLQPDTNAVIRSISKIEIVGNLIFIFSSDNISETPIFVFNKTGKFERKIGVAGRGPNEIPSQIYDFTIDSRNKILIILSNRLVSEYDFNGNLIRKIKLKAVGNHIAFHDKNIYINFSYPDHFTNDNYSISIYNIEGKFLKSIEDFSFFKTTYEEYQRSPRDALGIFQEINDSLVYWEPKIDTVFHIYHQKIYPKYLINRREDLKFKVRGFVENEKFVFFPWVVFNNKMQTYLYDKVTKRGTFIGYQTEDIWKTERFLLINDLDNGWPFMPRGLCSNGFLWDYFFDFQLDRYRNQSLSKEEIFERYKKSSSPDNPTIMLVK